MTRLEDLADSTLFDENTKFILIDDANKEIPSNMTMHVLADLTLIDENIARGTTDPWVDTITGAGTF